MVYKQVLIESISLKISVKLFCLNVDCHLCFVYIFIIEIITGTAVKNCSLWFPFRLVSLCIKMHMYVHVSLHEAIWFNLNVNVCQRISVL